MANADDNPDPVPLALSITLRPPTEADRLRRVVHGILSDTAESQGFETFEEANNFAIGDDYDPTSPWEMTIDEELEHARIVHAVSLDLRGEGPKQTKGEEDDSDSRVSPKAQRSDQKKTRKSPPLARPSDDEEAD